MGFAEGYHKTLNTSMFIIEPTCTYCTVGLMSTVKLHFFHLIFIFRFWSWTWICKEREEGEKRYWQHSNPARARTLEYVSLNPCKSFFDLPAKLIHAVDNWSGCTSQFFVLYFLGVIPEFLGKIDDTQYGTESRTSKIILHMRAYPEPKIMW